MHTKKDVIKREREKGFETHAVRVYVCVSDLHAHMESGSVIIYIIK